MRTRGKCLLPLAMALARCCVRKKMEELAKKLINFHKYMNDQLKRSGRSIEETIVELQTDVERFEDLKSKSYGECITQLTRTPEFKKFVEEHMVMRHDRLLRISETVMRVLTVEGNAQEIYESLLQTKREIESAVSPRKVNYYAMFDACKFCLDKGAVPTTDDIYEISLVSVEECTTHNALMATMSLLRLLIHAYRNQGNTEPIRIYLNPIQNLWKVDKDLRIVASEVIRAAYGTLSNCMGSSSVVNTLLFLERNDGDDVTAIRKSFEETEAFLQRDITDPPVTKFVQEVGTGLDQVSEEASKMLEELLSTKIKRNDNSLRRSILHLIAIFCHHDNVLNCIPNNLIDAQINERDIHGCTPLHLAYSHGNKSAIKFLESHNGRVPCQDHFGRFPEYYSVDRAADHDYEEYCADLMTNKSSVFESMKKMLVLPIHECEAIENNLIELSRRIVGDGEFLMLK